MRVEWRVARLERRVPPWDDSPEGQRQRLMDLLLKDAEAMDLVIRLANDGDRRFRGASPEALARANAEDPLRVALLARFGQRVAEIEGGAPPVTDFAERWRRRAAGLPPEGLDLTVSPPWGGGGVELRFLCGNVAGMKRNDPGAGPGRWSQAPSASITEVRWQTPPDTPPGRRG